MRGTRWPRPPSPRGAPARPGAHAPPPVPHSRASFKSSRSLQSFPLRPGSFQRSIHPPPPPARPPPLPTPGPSPTPRSLPLTFPRQPREGATFPAPLALPPTWNSPRKLGPSLEGISGAQQGPGWTGAPFPCPPPSPPPPPSPRRTWRKHGPPGGRGLTAPEVSNRKGKEGGNFLPSPHAGCQVQPPPLGLLLAAAPGPAPRPPLAPPSRPFFPSPSRLPPAAALAASASPRPPARARPRRGPSALR